MSAIRFPVPILMYHSISEHSSEHFRTWTVPPQLFDEHLQVLRDHHYTPLTVTQFVTAIDQDRLRLEQRPVVITFDDGFEDFYTHACPILGRYDCPATIYIVSGAVGGTSRWLAREGEGHRRMMSWPQVAAIHAQGIECGAHTHTHPQLDLLPLAEARDEITRSKAELEQHLGQPVTSFAYPHGYHGRAVRDLVVQAGFESACGVKHAMSATDDDRFALARIIVTRDTTAVDLQALLRGEGLRIAPQGERPQTALWRVVRRSRRRMEQVIDLARSK